VNEIQVQWWLSTTGGVSVFWSSGFWLAFGSFRDVVLADVEHDEDNIAAASCEANESGVVFFAFGAFAVVNTFNSAMLHRHATSPLWLFFRLYRSVFCRSRAILDTWNFTNFSWGFVAYLS
jgi:hypothetical protein